MNFSARSMTLVTAVSSHFCDVVHRPLLLDERLGSKAGAEDPLSDLPKIKWRLHTYFQAHAFYKSNKESGATASENDRPIHDPGHKLERA